MIRCHRIETVTVNGASVGWDRNGEPADVLAEEAALHERYYLVKLGKKKYHLFELA